MWARWRSQWQLTTEAQGCEPFQRFRSLQDVQRAAQRGIRIDVNQATVDDWLRLPGISIHQARSLVHLVQTGVRFYHVDDLAAALNLPPQALQPFLPILQFCYYDPHSLSEVQPTNVNLASVEQLVKVPAIDLYLARLIVSDRQRHGRYGNLADLQCRLNLPATLITELLHFVCF